MRGRPKIGVKRAVTISEDIARAAQELVDARFYSSVGAVLRAAIEQGFPIIEQQLKRAQLDDLFNAL